MSLKKRRPDGEAEKALLTIEEQYRTYKEELSAFYKKNKKSYVSGLYEKLVSCGIFVKDVQKFKDVPWQLIKMMAKADFDNSKKNE